VRSRRGDSVTQVLGHVKENSLTQVVLETGEGEQRYDSSQVLRVSFGDVPMSYRDGVLYEGRGDHALAAGSYRQAATDGEARPLVRAAARLAAADSLMSLAASDAAHYPEAADEARRFLSDYPENREVPRAQMLLARALLLSGKPAESATAYREVFDKLTGGEAPAGYDRALCYQAGLSAAEALLASPTPDTLGAREIYSSLASTLGPIVAGGDDSHEMRALSEVLDEATLGEGFAELAAGNTQPALTFFQAKQRALDGSSSSALRYGVMLGLGECLFADVKLREAQLAFAEVSALDHTSHDRVARALLRQAEVGIKLADPRETILPLLTAVDQSYGDTLWAAPARELLKSLK